MNYYQLKNLTGEIDEEGQIESFAPYFEKGFLDNEGERGYYTRRYKLISVYRSGEDYFTEYHQVGEDNDRRTT